MKLRILTVMLIGSLGIPGAFAKPKRQGKAHVHGQAQVDIVTDGNKASISFNIDTHSLTGFEHAPKTVKEKAAVEKVYKVFRSNISKMFVFDSKLNCQFQERKLQIGLEGKHESKESEDDHQHEDHQSLKGDFDIQCNGKLSPGKIQVDLKSSFSAIEKMNIQVVSDSGVESIDLPGLGEIILR